MVRASRGWLRVELSARGRPGASSRQPSQGRRYSKTRLSSPAPTALNRKTCVADPPDESWLHLRPMGTHEVDQVNCFGGE